MTLQNQTKYRQGPEIEKLIGQVFKLQALPTSVQRVNQLLNDEKATAEDISREIAKDVALSAQVLKLVNSGFYGFSTPVVSLSHATVLLGFNVMRSLVMATTIGDFTSSAVAGLWQHSLACGRLAALLCRRLGGEEPEELSAIGLLHDIGKVFFAQYLPDECAAMRALVQQENILLLEAEKRITGVDHAVVAGFLLQRWKLPAAVVAPIEQHHAIQPAHPFARRTAMVHLADVLVRAGGYGSGGDARLPQIQSAAMELLELKPEDMPSLVEEMTAELFELS